MNEKYTNSLIDSIHKYITNLYYLGKNDLKVIKDLGLLKIIQQLYIQSDWYDISDKNKIKLERLMDCIILRNSSLVLSTVIPSCSNYSNTNTPQTIYTWQKICKTSVPPIPGVIIERCFMNNVGELTWPDTVYGQMDTTFDVNGFPREYIIGELIINGINYVNNQTLIINNINDLSSGIGLDGLLHTTTLSDWVTSIIPSGLNITFHDNMRVVDKPFGTTFKISIVKTTSHEYSNYTYSFSNLVGGITRWPGGMEDEDDYGPLSEYSGCILLGGENEFTLKRCFANSPYTSDLWPIWNYGAMEEQFSAQHMPLTFFIQSIIINGIEIIAGQTLTINSINDLIIGIGFAGGPTVMNVSDWITSCLPEESHITFYDNMKVIDYPNTTTFNIIISKSLTEGGEIEYTYTNSEASVDGFGGGGGDTLSVFGSCVLVDNFIPPNVVFIDVRTSTPEIEVAPSFYAYIGDLVEVYLGTLEGFNFVNWTVNGIEVSTSQNYYFMASESIIITANFEEIPTPQGLELIFVVDPVLGIQVPVANASSLPDWNAFFDLPTNGTPFTSVVVNGDKVTLIGGSGITLKDYIFSSNVNILSFIDNTPCIIAMGDHCFYTTLVSTIIAPICETVLGSCFSDSGSLANIYVPILKYAHDSAFTGCTILQKLNLSLLLTAGDYCFAALPSLNEIILSSCTNLGSSVGNDGVFYSSTSRTITLTIPSALMTCNGGNPDGDIQYLMDNNTVTIITI